ncbi:MAG: 30S ribosomal protein S4 [Alphaproteobacteria bacterium]|nr:30S ribosomal protein S4 [Alphaproteobacteria bacterium]
MSGKRNAAKHKIDRRLGCNLWGRAKSPYNLRQTGPGMHGARRGKPTDYGTQLKAKQKLKGYYGNIGEKQFRRYYQEAIRLRGDTGQNLIGLLERRLDAVVYRAKFAPTVFSARQIVNHGHILVNGKRVNIPSFLIKDGDIVEVRQKSKEMPLVMEALASQERDVPEYIDLEEKARKATFLRTPKLEDVPYAVHMEPSLVVEFYSR